MGRTSSGGEVWKKGLVDVKEEWELERLSKMKVERGWALQGSAWVLQIFTDHLVVFTTVPQFLPHLQ